LAVIAAWMAQAKLVLQRDTTHLIDARTQSFDFLGKPIRRWPSLAAQQEPDEVQGCDLRQDTSDRRPTPVGNHRRSQSPIGGWFAYFKDSYRTTFSTLDG
jgi:hypothetical protein